MQRSLAIWLTWLCAAIVIARAAPQQLVQPDSLAGIPTPSSDTNDTPAAGPNQQKQQRRGERINTTLNIPSASWAGVCSPGNTTNVRFVVKAKKAVIDNVLLVSHATYEKLASQPGQRISSSMPNPWLPLSCEEGDIASCERDSEQVPWAAPLPNARWCVIAGNQARAVNTVVDMDVGWAAGVGPTVSVPPPPTNGTDAASQMAGGSSNAARTASGTTAQRLTALFGILSVLVYSIVC